MTGVIIAVVLVIVAILAGVVYLIVTGIKRSKDQQDEDPLEARLAEYSMRGDVVSLEEIELSQPFVDRVILPLIRRFGEIASRFTPQNVLVQTRRRLELGGNPGRIDASTFIMLHFISAGLFGGVVLLLSLGSKTFTIPVRLMIVLFFIVVGYFFPDLYFKEQNRP